MPSLYKETAINKELIRIVEMGPWKHRVDDGLEARKTAYETMYTLVSHTCHGYFSAILTSVHVKA